MLIDPSIRDWVMIPILILAFIAIYVRIYASRLLNADKKMNKEELSQRNLVGRSACLRTNNGYISYDGFQKRKNFLTAEGTGKLHEDVKANMAMNPIGQMDMLKQQMVMMGTNMGLGMFTQNFTSGFLALRLPFGLTERFKSLTQAGVGVSNLDTSYVSSTSWYMMSAFGVPRLIQLFNRGNASAIAEAQSMQMQMGPMPGMGGAPGQWNGKNAYKSELSAMSTVQWSPAPLLAAEKELLEEAKLLRMKSSKSKKSD